MKKIWLAFLLAAALWSACNVEPLPPDSSNEPVFFVDFSVGEDSVDVDSFKAGVGNIYHYTRNEPLNAGAGAVAFSGFSQVGCPTSDCPGSLRFEFRGNFVDSLFSGGFYRYRLSDSSDLRNQYILNANISAANIFNFTQLFADDVLIGQGGNGAFVVFQNAFQGSSPRRMRLVGTGPQGLLSVVERKVSFSGAEQFPKVFIEAREEQGFYSVRAITDGGGPVVEYFWNTGDSSSMLVGDSAVWQSDYRVTVTDAGGNTASASLENFGAVASGGIIQSVNFSIGAESFFDEFLHGISVQWVDNEGIVWRSDLADQPGWANFQITNREAYEPNELGEPTYKVSFSAHCLLFREGGGVKEFEGTGVLAIAFP
jgi:hypothetical protein